MHPEISNTRKRWREKRRRWCYQSPEARATWKEINHCRGCLAEAEPVEEGCPGELEAQRRHREGDKYPNFSLSSATQCPSSGPHWLNSAGKMKPKKHEQQRPSSL